jgi:lipopolysaccharide/colanic/teichoic acid biosynthesis glycosyltransferase
VIEACDELGILLWIVPEALLLRRSKSLRIWRLPGQFPLPGVLLAPPHWDSSELFFKRLLDLGGSLLLLVFLAPLLGLIALAVKLSDRKAPIFYPWRVIGENGVPFTGYKFRTMVPNADALKADLEKHNEMIGPVFKMTNDPRVTRVGRILRKFSLDELPQLWSVVKGNMSLVGPRPAGPHELARYEFWHKRKLTIKPGMTCLWQVRGRNAVNDFDDWVRMDLEYIDNWSLWLDFKILVMTALAVLKGTGK